MVADAEVLANSLKALDNDMMVSTPVDHITSYYDDVFGNNEFDIPRPTLEEVSAELDDIESWVNQLQYRITQAKEIVAEMKTRASITF
jgi:hypothetical protein